MKIVIFTSFFLYGFDGTVSPQVASMKLWGGAPRDLRNKADGGKNFSGGKKGGGKGKLLFPEKEVFPSLPPDHLPTFSRKTKFFLKSYFHNLHCFLRKNIVAFLEKGEAGLRDEGIPFALITKTG